MFAEFAEFVLDFLVGRVPARQPWRALVALLYVVLAAASVVALTWIVVTTL